MARSTKIYCEVEGFGRLKSVGRYSIWWRLVKEADEAMGLWGGENEVGGNLRRREG